MIHVVNLDETAASENDHRTIWRLLTAETVGTQVGAVSGVVAYKRSITPDDTEVDLGAAHDKPEFYYVLSGSGMICAPSTRRPIRAGDAFLIEAGVPHALVSSSADEPVVTFYVSMK